MSNQPHCKHIDHDFDPRYDACSKCGMTRIQCRALAATTSDAAQAPSVELPERVIDKLFQAADISTCGPDGEDILDRLHAFARNVVAETLARLPAIPQAAGDAGQAASDAAEFAKLQTFLTEHHEATRPSYPAGLAAWALAALTNARRAAFNEAASVDAKVIAMLMAAGKVSREDVDVSLAKVAALPQPTTPRSTAEEIDAVFRRNLDLLIQNLTVDSDNKITWMAISCRGVEQGLYPLASKRADHYQQLLGVAYVVLGCLAANGVDIHERFLDAFSDPDSVENPLELLPCDFSPARAVRAVVEQASMTDQQIQALWDEACKDSPQNPGWNRHIRFARALLKEAK